MATRTDQAPRTEQPGYRMEELGDRVAGEHDETKWALLTTEFWAMVALIAAVLIAAAVSDSLDDIRAWTLVTVIGAAYIVSRGIAKAGSDVPFCEDAAAAVRPKDHLLTSGPAQELTFGSGPLEPAS